VALSSIPLGLAFDRLLEWIPLIESFEIHRLRGVPSSIPTGAMCLAPADLLEGLPTEFASDHHAVGIVHTGHGDVVVASVYDQVECHS
jgi:hypothetical protein